jgi:hypothetical protein
MYVKQKQRPVLARALDQWLDAAQDGLFDVSLKDFQELQKLRVRCEEEGGDDPSETEAYD